MKSSKVKIIIATALATALLGGCGDTPDILTEEEQNIIVNYSAHIVSKFNSNQTEGLTIVSMSETELSENTELPENTEILTEHSTEAVQQEISMDAGNPGETEENAQTAATLDELFGSDGLTITYTGAYLKNHYMESTYYSLDAVAGKTYLIVGIDIENTGSSDVTVDNLSLAPAFSVVVNETEQANAEFTVLLDDFSTYEGIVQAGTTQSTVILFQIPDTVETVENVVLSVRINGLDYQITL